MNTIEQERAKFALAEIKNKLNAKVDKKTASFLQGLPTMILNNGLGQTMAFLLSKTESKNDKDDKYYFAFNMLKKWLTWDMHNNDLDDISFLHQLTKISQEKYIENQKEALALLQWVKRYARAFQSE